MKSPSNDPATRPRRSHTRMTPSGDQCRCSCGSLLARVVREGLELKCRKCKSLVLIRHEELVEMYRGLDFGPSIRLEPTEPR